MTVLQGRLADRDAWSAVGECPIEKTMALLGTGIEVHVVGDARKPRSYGNAIHEAAITFS